MTTTTTPPSPTSKHIDYLQLTKHILTPQGLDLIDTNTWNHIQFALNPSYHLPKTTTEREIIQFKELYFPEKTAISIPNIEQSYIFSFIFCVFNHDEVKALSSNQTIVESYTNAILLAQNTNHTKVIIKIPFILETNPELQELLVSKIFNLFNDFIFNIEITFTGRNEQICASFQDVLYKESKLEKYQGGDEFSIDVKVDEELKEKSVLLSEDGIQDEVFYSSTRIAVITPVSCNMDLVLSDHFYLNNENIQQYTLKKMFEIHNSFWFYKIKEYYTLIEHFNIQNKNQTFYGHQLSPNY
jgi:hypothetical protein